MRTVTSQLVQVGLEYTFIYWLLITFPKIDCSVVQLGTFVFPEIVFEVVEALEEAGKE